MSESTTTLTQGEDVASSFSLTISDISSNSTAMSTSTDDSLSSVTSCPAEPTETTAPPPSLTVGQAVGVGIGSAFGGAFLVLGLVLIYCCRNKHRAARKSSSRRSPLVETYPRERPPPPAPIPPREAALEQLKGPLAHRRIRQKMENLETGIKNLVDNCFGQGHVSIDEDTDLRIQALAGMPPEGSTWSKALNTPSLRDLVIRAIISQALFALIDPQSDRDMTLLPPNFQRAYRSLRANVGSRRGGIGISQELLLLSCWRRISGQFLSGHDRLDSIQIQSVTDELSAILALFPPDHGQEINYQSSLSGLVTEAAALGMDLFEQPHEWKAIWTRSSGRYSGDEVSVFPDVKFCSKGQPKSNGHGIEDADITVSTQD